MSKISLIILLAMPLLALNQDRKFSTAKIQTIIDLMEEITSAEKDKVSLNDDDQDEARSDAYSRMYQTTGDMRRLTVASGSLGSFHAFLINVLEHVEVDDDVDRTVRQLDDYVGRIEVLWNFFRSYAEPNTEFNQNTITDYVNSITNTDDDRELPGILDKLQEFVTDNDFLNLISDALKNGPPGTGCNLGVSLHDELFQIYNAIVISQVRGFVMITYSYTLKTINEKEDYSGKLDGVKSQAIEAIQQYSSLIKTALDGVPRAIERCDAEEKTRETYADFTQLMQLFVVNEVDTNSGHSCSEKCGDINNVHPNRGGCYDGDYYCYKRPCRGKLYECDSLTDTSLCEYDADDMKHYQWILTGYGTVYGNKGNSSYCDGSWGNARSWTAWNYCDTCACVCIEMDAASKAVRTVSLKPQVTSIQYNMVVTAVRLVEIERVVQIQIKQGELMPFGRVNRQTTEWVELPRWYYDDQASGGGYSAFDETDNKWVDQTEDKDYTFVTYYNRGLHLDDITLDSDYVVTGVKFAMTSNNAMELQVRGTRFDFDSGQLQVQDSKWITADTMSNPPEAYSRERQELKLEKSYDPLLAPKNLPDSEPNQFVNFWTTDRIRDAGQNTIPFLDIQPVSTTPPAALNGIGIYHMGAEEFGGFVALRTFALDKSVYLED